MKMPDNDTGWLLLWIFCLGAFIWWTISPAQATYFPSTTIVGPNGINTAAVNSDGSLVVAPDTPPSVFWSDRTCIATTGTAVELNSHTTTRFVTLAGLPANTASIGFGPNSSITASNGDSVYQTDRVAVVVSNSSDIWINGTSGDCVRYSGS